MMNSMEFRMKIWLFSGTTEGRLLAKRLAGVREVSLDVSVATQYGKEGVSAADNIRVLCGRLDSEEMVHGLEREHYDLVLDATHPYAREVSENIRQACERAGVRLLRVLRDREDGCTKDPAAACCVCPGQPDACGDSCPDVRSVSCPDACGGACADEKEDGRAGTGRGQVCVGSVDEAVEYLKRTKGNILVTTGSKELRKFTKLPGWGDRVYARVLSLPAVVSQCASMGFYGRRLIAMEGPFSREMNLALLHSTGAAWMVTKESGAAGGFDEKAEAARMAGVGLVVIGRPEEKGISLRETLNILKADYGIVPTPPTRRITLIGAGPGNPKLITAAARERLMESQLIAGAPRLVEPYSSYGKTILNEYKPEGILAFLDQHSEYEEISVLLSGDTGFYSGARKLLEELEVVPNMEITVLPGISSMSYFFARLKLSWENVTLLSLHGREANLVQAVERSPMVFCLAGGKDGLKEICKRLLDGGLSHVTVTVGENLSLPEEKLTVGSPADLMERDTAPLFVVLVENPVAEQAGSGKISAGKMKAEKTKAGKNRLLSHGIKDEAFIRGGVPMTKMEVRTVSVSKLGLMPGAVVYDVGAGTGSVSVECAGLSDTVEVYAVERNPEALELMRKNKSQFGLSNLHIEEGEAPEALLELPAPTHVFIGGSGGRLKEIITAVLKKNPRARFVVNLITLESIATMMELLKAMPLKDEDIVQLTAARDKKVGSSHLMMGLNPVWIVSFQGSGE